jgi:GH24 family phage-related lysozyme (muramidase)
VYGAPNKIAAAASFAYNCGTGALAKLAASGFSRWLDYNKSGGVVDHRLVLRRAEEFALWNA